MWQSDGKFGLISSKVFSGFQTFFKFCKVSEFSTLKEEQMFLEEHLPNSTSICANVWCLNWSLSDTFRCEVLAKCRRRTNRRAFGGHCPLGHFWLSQTQKCQLSAICSAQIEHFGGDWAHRNGDSPSPNLRQFKWWHLKMLCSNAKSTHMHESVASTATKWTRSDSLLGSNSEVNRCKAL